MVVRAAEGSQLIRMGVSRMEEMNKKPQVTMLQVEAAQSRLPTSRALQGASKVSLWFLGGHGTGAGEGQWAADSNCILLVCNKERVLGHSGWLLDDSPVTFLDVRSCILQ